MISEIYEKTSLQVARCFPQRYND